MSSAGKKGDLDNTTTPRSSRNDAKRVVDFLRVSGKSVQSVLSRWKIYKMRMRCFSPILFWNSSCEINMRNFHSFLPGELFQELSK